MYKEIIYIITYGVGVGNCCLLQNIVGLLQAKNKTTDRQACLSVV